jgi:outer membrane protein assembly factor BamB
VPPILLALLIAPAADPVPATWPQWRGPARDGFAAGPDWPDTLAGDALTQRWRVEELGPSYSGPVVGADRVFIT